MKVCSVAMCFRTATRTKGDKLYQSLHLVESYRTKDGKVGQRILINFDSAHRYTKEEVREIIGALSQFFGLEEVEPKLLSPDCSLDFGGTYGIFRIWEEVGWSEIFTRPLRAHRHDFDVIANVKVLVANRLLDPMAKLHILDWMEGVHFPGIERGAIDYNHLLRAMDFLIEHKGELEPPLASPLLTLFDTPLSRDGARETLAAAHHRGLSQWQEAPGPGSGHRVPGSSVQGSRYADAPTQTPY